ncbi:hypothetical protein [Pedobacter nototheniae]|uniref:hypothetical protein n=1 Tax=Pedobacter nototheniae TaxID=2488994 RepID=UPI0010401E9F|nr:hypothetical protein [Pedobacter nototheniae]
MAKNIKAIKCPNCGSIHKTEIKPDYFRCDSCQTEYYLDNDDINVNVNYNHNSAQPILTPEQTSKKVALIFGALVMFVLMVFFFLIPSSKKSKTDKIEEKEKYDYSSIDNAVYMNSVSNEVMYMRIAREHLREKNGNYDFVNTHIVVVNPITKKQVKDQIIFNRIRRLDDHSSNFKITSDHSIYMVYNESKLFKLDKAANTLVDITETMFKNHPEISAGIAKISFNNDNLVILTNEGNKFNYLIASDQLFKDEDWKAFETARDKLITEPYFSFNYTDKLSKVLPGEDYDKNKPGNFTPDRKYFQPEIIYQDKTSLLISMNANASDRAPLTLQSLDVNTGKVLWVLPGKPLNYRIATKCKEGFAVHYFAGEEMDYISGVYIISPEGKILYDYQIARNE